MCTAIFQKTSTGSFFGRNLDVEKEYGEKVYITPRNFGFCFKNKTVLKNNYAMIGMGIISEGYPLYFDATNEYGLSAAGLNFPRFAHYNNKIEGKINIASFEIIPYFLAQYKTVAEVISASENMSIWNIPFSPALLPTPLHWMIADKERCVCLEQTKNGLKIFENQCGVLTNSPSFDIQLFDLNNYLSLSSDTPENSFAEKLNLEPYSRGMGALGLPGDFSSRSRFVRACFIKMNMHFGEMYKENVNNFFHLLNSVYQYKGCVKVGKDYEYTAYSSCCDMDNGIYRYTTYDNRTEREVFLHRQNLNCDKIIVCD